MEHAHLLLQRHQITEGLTEEQVLEQSTICEQITLQTGDILHSAGETVDSIFLLVQGRLKQTTQASNSLDRVNNYMVPGTQFGGVAAVRNEPLEIQVSAVEPSTALKINFLKGFLPVANVHTHQHLIGNGHAALQSFVRALCGRLNQYAISGRPLRNSMTNFCRFHPHAILDQQ